MTCIRAATAAAVLAFLLVACTSPKELNTLQTLLAGIEARLSTLENAQREFSDLNAGDRLTKLESDYVDLDLKDSFLPTKAYLKVGSQGFSLGTTTYGRVAVFLEDIKPLGSGARAELQVINLTSVTLTGVVAHVDYSNWLIEDLAASAADRSPRVSKSADIKVIESLRPGHSRLIRLNLPGIPHDKIKDLSISFTADGIQYVSG
jgi:hypothetical protein